MPVQVMELYINEDAFDPALNPKRAAVAVKLRILSEHGLPSDHKGYDYLKSYIEEKIGMAKTAYRDVPKSFVVIPTSIRFLNRFNKQLLAPFAQLFLFSMR